MFEKKPSLVATAVFLATLGLTGCGGGSGGSTTTPTPSTNVAPTDIALSNNDVVENAVAAVVGTLTTTDADANETFSYAVDDARFEVAGGELKLVADTALDFEAAATVDVKVTVTDSGSHSLDKTFTINVTDILEAPSTYAFESRFQAGSSVSYGGQIARHVLISELYDYIGGQLQDDVEADMFASGDDALVMLKSFYHISSTKYDEEVADRALNLSTSLGNEQTSLRLISSSHKDLDGKIAGNDDALYDAVWKDGLMGWNETGSITPAGLANELMGQIAQNVQTYIDGEQRHDPQGNVITKLYLSENGIDLKQMLQKFLLGAVAFSQAADDYLDDTQAGKGLRADNTVAAKDGSKPYTDLEHGYDEGFGYFGAARNYNEFTDAEVAGKGGREDWQKYHDADDNGSISLTSEYNFGHSTNAAKRDLGSATNANPTDFSKTAFDAFLMGRTIITDANGALTDEQMSALKAQRDIIMMNWEKSISATVVHYINEVIADLGKLDTDDYDYATAAKHWSELKGFALNFQFNPRSPLSADAFVFMHELIGMESVSDSANAAIYIVNLLLLRDLIAGTYGFDADNVAAW